MKDYSDEERAGQYLQLGELFSGKQNFAPLRAIFKAYAGQSSIPASVSRDTFRHFTSDTALVSSGTAAKSGRRGSAVDVPTHLPRTSAKSG